METELTRRRSLVERMQGAALLHIDVYEEVEADTTATSQAAVVVGIVAVAAAVGGLSAGGQGFFSGLLGAYVGWLVWSGLTYLIGDRIFGGTATWGELLRTIGFAQAPGVLLVLALVPVLGGIAVVGVRLWMLVTGIVAIRQALDFDTGRAILTALLGWLAAVLVALVAALVAGVPIAP
ncbi:MAG: YIP1 family protein [Gemmatimonadota bacterium]